MPAFAGCTPVGTPLVGRITTAYGARVGMAVCGLVPLVTALLVVARGRRSAADRVQLGHHVDGQVEPGSRDVLAQVLDGRGSRDEQDVG